MQNRFGKYRTSRAAFETVQKTFDLCINRRRISILKHRADSNRSTIICSCAKPDDLVRRLSPFLLNLLNSYQRFTDASDKKIFST